MTKNLSNKYLLFILGVVGFIYLKSSWGKIMGGEFVNNLGGTLGKFAAKNPYPWMQNFLQNVAIPNSNIFGLLTMWGEFLSALAILVSVFCLVFSSQKSKLFILLLLAGCFVGLFLNLIFYFAAGWTSSSTESLNLLMFVIELAGLVYGLKLLKE
ncbi:hypothetical protein A3B42_01510 [Candidatus Daviesbacteria bacterium RIFCSPLOWO2_01_FULL_38_10]|uniref:DoxX n=1 Tax=Candidatus Daviesbacteria bacterium GW2011_GWF2_38_6 TaxID=1618432 RepID=A0A0G0NIP2_9BACT|nr:MAG: DoxX [Candidatus Daviesbacteria bacterium GW2011_GWA2_38_17]KKQ76976.1 MAG: DoxX [Candidatus Daviesbacteria bacterium GW2011_GWF2_38_6]OGE25836.1 MAG: hypothetical protein A3D02_04420 [Candidatus Daviesbacteria bacterium RIFCSPHIGHO2_02_FULL_39_41]OGE36931.1 MAG: hypothetical protein A3B42_01510 [Candidatus Daviesbacteria bacterium RIFCSPLOWO2_01_FULL_38_10]OGE45609.1 MAG: hypothetical protein A3E67_01940 [Candidatus Daviesbacteria bacterium RIFCSPHIGHO2_12_FULL_38_25]OGE68335.1 MAG: h